MKANLSYDKQQQEVLTAWMGQLLIFCLKCDEQELLLLHDEFVPKMHDLLATRDEFYCQKAISQANASLFRCLGTRFSLTQEAIDLLTEKFDCFVQSFLQNKNNQAAIANLRITDAWSGLTSCLIKNPMPLSLLDYVMDIVLPLVSADLMPELCQDIFNILKTDDDIILLEKIDNTLSEIVCRICFGRIPHDSMLKELSLAVLLHIPQINEQFVCKLGYIYKLLNAQYANMEVK